MHSILEKLWTFGGVGNRPRGKSCLANLQRRKFFSGSRNFKKLLNGFVETKFIQYEVFLL